jgi:hypothetical protein
VPHNTPKEEAWIDFIRRRHQREDEHVAARPVLRAIGDEVLLTVPHEGDGAHAPTALAADLALAGSGTTQAVQRITGQQAAQWHTDRQANPWQAHGAAAWTGAQQTTEPSSASAYW